MLRSKIATIEMSIAMICIRANFPAMESALCNLLSK